MLKQLSTLTYPDQVLTLLSKETATPVLFLLMIDPLKVNPLYTNIVSVHKHIGKIEMANQENG